MCWLDGATHIGKSISLPRMVVRSDTLDTSTSILGRSLNLKMLNEQLAKT